MFPGVNPKQMDKMMKKMGMSQEEIDATEVIIKTPTGNLIIDNPQVSKVNMMGQDTIQVVGSIREEEIDTTPEINEDDLKAVMEQTGVDKETAKKALELTKGDIAEAILGLQD